MRDRACVQRLLSARILSDRGETIARRLDSVETASGHLRPLLGQEHLLDQDEPLLDRQTLGTAQDSAWRASPAWSVITLVVLALTGGLSL